jgi:CheY-like chemotaxis protein
MLAHELRNPLAPIRNALHIIRVKAPPQPQLAWARDLIERQLLQLNRLVDDLLDVSRITKGKIELRKERLELRTVMTSAIEASRPIIHTFGHRLAVKLPEESVCIDGDLTRLAQVLSNLLNNAAKYTPSGGDIAISADIVRDAVLIRVRDNGIGMSPEMIPHIFEMFTQVDSSLERAQGGLGIGLTLVRLLVELHGGSVEARSEGLGAGSEFIVRLPLYGGPNPRRNMQNINVAESRGSFTQRRILVVDDNSDAAESLSILLQLAGSEVHTSHDGIEALEAVTRVSPDVVILDIGLPGMNGYDVARRIREEHGDRILLIALTGWGQEEDRRKSEAAGFDHHLTKPIGLDALREVLLNAPQR